MARHFRRSDGSPEYRSPEELLKEAGEEATAGRLPGHGKPIDLTRYFSSDAESRAAHKLLADNAVLPRPLQHLKDAEAALATAQELIARRGERLQELRTDISLVLSRLIAELGRHSVLDLTSWTDIPESLAAEPDPAGGPRDTIHLAADLADRMDRYQRIRRHLVQEQAKAHTAAREHLVAFAKTQSLATGVNRISPSVRATDIERAEQAFAEAYPDLPPLPPGFADRVARPSDAAPRGIRHLLGSLFG